MSTFKSAVGHVAAFVPLLIITITTILSLTPSSSASSQHPIHRTNELGFSVNLFHRDSPQSPFYNPTLTKSDRINAAVQRSRSRRPYRNEPRTQVTYSYESGEYVMNFSIGTPPVQTYAIVDTASELVWFQCLPCDNCFKQKLPIFDPSQSYTYEILGCEDQECSLSKFTICNSTGHTCAYNLRYVDGSVSRGDLSLDTLTFSYPSPSGQIKLSHMVIGCGHRNRLPLAVGPPGVIGLNRKTLSFIRQLTYFQFSYCFVETNSNLSSQMRFQSEAVLSGGKTPILDGIDDAYFLYLKGISVGSKRIPFPPGIFNMTSSGAGGFMIDSGTTFTELHRVAYIMTVDEIILQMHDEVIRTEPWGEFMPCYMTTIDVIKQVAPDLTFHFSGLDLVLNKKSTWMSVDHGRVCLAILPADAASETLSIFGNFQQQNMNVGFDLEKKLVSFMNMENCNSVNEHD